MRPITIKLNQHTPVLHFQHDAVAPIRATELKPKLDKFIIANYHGEVPDEWFVKTDNKANALNYKMRIRCESASPVRCQTDRRGKPILPMFFGDGKTAMMASNTVTKGETIKTENSIEIELFCFNQRLQDYLEKEIDWQLFFLGNNFGTRQDKGYGSFSVEGKHLNAKNLCGSVIRISEDIAYRVDSFFTVRSGNNDWNVVMGHINDVYKCLRGGINENGLYFKSLMFAYAKSEGKFWDKRIIKEEFYPKDLKEQREKHPKSEELALPDDKKQHIMFRDFLGLSTFENWREPYHKKITKKDPEKKISRFKSPLLFKPIWFDGKWYMFLLHRDIPASFFKASFIVKDSDENYIRDMKPFQDFSMTKYLNYIFDRNYQYEKHFQKPINEKANCILKDLNAIRDNYVRINTL